MTPNRDGLTVQELAPMDRGIRAWTFCFCSFLLETMIWGFCFSYGIFQNYYTTHPPFNSSSRMAIAAVGTIAIGLQYIEMFQIACVYGRYPDYMNRGMWIGLALYFLPIFGARFATRVSQLILLQGVVFGISGGLLYVPILKLIPEYFSERSGLASGIIFAGGGVGGFFFAFILNALLDQVGLRWTLRIWAIGSTIVSGIALLGVRPRLPVPTYASGQRRPRFIPPQLGLMKNPLFWSVSLTIALQGLSYFPVLLYITSFTTATSTPLTAVIVTSIFNSSAVGGQIVLGHLSDRYPYPWVMFLSAVGSGIVAFLLWGLASSATQLYFFAVIFGALSDGSSTWANASFDCAGGRPEHAGLALGGTSVFKGISAVIGPVISGLLLDAGRGSSIGGVLGQKGYGMVEIFVGSCAIATGAGSILVAFMSRRANHVS
ncbi:MFS general substrate transporter [Dichomitus squalens LYAD-421 SS1]|uniref:MFS general substrate transporter n=1 Tax=Dichomitus squalens (strain LYAD-421) TaxID=732165 RepID=R7SPC0_DICSQ|nr:MFS general substrate transporter [Dichomitus squalens LYAD-421 SS1]EJF57758.1 MFS general substrate transporter [Dichomitus squalens LYAD-421 SS1]